MGTESVSTPGPPPEPVTPVPVREAVNAPAERFTVSVPVRVPARTGVKLTLTLQLLPEVRDEQLVVSAKSPVAVTLLTLTAVVPVFVTVTVWPTLVVPTVAVPRFRLPAERVTAALPVPLRLTVCGLFGALSLNVSVPEAAPVKRCGLAEAIGDIRAFLG